MFLLQTFRAHLALAYFSMVSVQEGSRCTQCGLQPLTGFTFNYLQTLVIVDTLKDRENKKFLAPVSHGNFFAFVCIGEYEKKNYPCLSIIF